MPSETTETPDPIRFTCPGCGKIAKAPPDYAGRTCQCPKCGTSLIIPGAEPSAFAPPVSANEYAVTDDIRAPTPPSAPAISSVIKQSGLLENPDIDAAKRREHSRMSQAVTMQHWESPFFAGFWMFLGACWASLVISLAVLVAAATSLLLVFMLAVVFQFFFGRP